jgi:hypothetical protein
VESPCFKALDDLLHATVAHDGDVWRAKATCAKIRLTGLEVLILAPSNLSSPYYIRAVPTIDLPDDELAAVAAAIRRAIEDDKYPHAPRLDPLRAALARLDAALALEPTPPKGAQPVRGDKRRTRDG